MSPYTGPALSSRQVERLWLISIGYPPVMNDVEEMILRRHGLVEGDPYRPTVTGLGRAALAGESS
ncbi:hypothetical protein [Ornithinimicrobium sufpigmenti]|uniref:hypothetical protein n=1 Tax=Ornithinimicrobium sufpigmenti TaxID=2508882 RepID=UPI00103691B4|nr:MULTISPECIES: hypothetical protein [unclassified Ornithinimicrobium]